MKKLLKKIMAEVGYGMRHALVVSRSRPYFVPAERSFPIDAANLRLDANRVARGLTMQFRK